MVTGCPTASASVYPKIRCADAFQLVIMRSRFLEMIASSEDSTMAASLRRDSSACRRSVTSRIALATTRPAARPPSQAEQLEIRSHGADTRLSVELPSMEALLLVETLGN